MSLTKAFRVALFGCALGTLGLAGAAGWGASQDAPEQPSQGSNGAETENGRRRSVRLVLPWSALEDLTPRQDATIREIRAQILEKKEELDRQERERIMEVLTESQRQRVKEIEQERAAREQEQRERARDRDGSDDAGEDPGI
jgi:hypothetical protein